MRRHSRLASVRCIVAGVAIALSGCMAALVFKDVPASTTTPAEIALEPERYHGLDVVWGGKILDVRNLADTTEVEIIAYPIDGAQRPDQNAPTEGRFVLELSGYVESLDFPAGRFVTLHGRVAGTRTGQIDQHDVALPLVSDAAVHLWPVNFPYDEPRVHFSFGVGVGIH
jgi:outer membrane lipoprotein